MTGAAVADAVSRERIALAVGGLDGGRGELTWGQRFVWDILQSLAPANHYLNIRFRVHLPGHVTRDGVLSALRTLVCDHEVLRTRFSVGPDGEPGQQCDRAGELPVEICETEPGRVRRLAEQEEERLWREPFRHESQWPVRVSVIVAGGRPRQVVFVFSHLAADSWGCTVLRGQFLDLLREERAAPGPVGWQPRARAAFEASQPGRKANDLAMGYWRRVLESAPQTAFPAQPTAWESPRFPGVGLHSVALAAAARTVAARYRVGPAAVLLGTLSAIIGIRTDTDLVPLLLAAGNRFTPVDAVSVGTFYQAAPALIRLDRRSLAGTIRNAHKASTMAYLRGQSDPRDVARLVDSVNARRGTSIDLSSTVNVVPEPPAAGTPPAVHDAAELRAMAATTEVSDLEGRDAERLKLYAHVKSLRSRAIIELFCDSRYLTASDARKVLTGLELVLIELIEAGDPSIDRVAELVAIAPLAVPDGCAVVDNCRIDAAAVRTLVAGLPSVFASQVFVDREDDGAARLVAYIAAAQPATPEQLHNALISRLDGSLTMAPHSYVICDGAPARPECRADWERRTVLALGSGRPVAQPAPAHSTTSLDARQGA
ncbi:MAG TPA: condensation domain-containing protein [Actinocrinis sp.]|nr:condensation domain-containing protein [Actinocrinis sp.]